MPEYVTRVLPGPVTVRVRRPGGATRVRTRLVGGGTGGGGSFDGVHNDLAGRSTAGAHPASAIDGLGSAALASTDDFATAAQGALADSALQPGEAGVLAAQFHGDSVTIADLGGSVTGDVLTCAALAGTAAGKQVLFTAESSVDDGFWVSNGDGTFDRGLPLSTLLTVAYAGFVVVAGVNASGLTRLLQVATSDGGSTYTLERASGVVEAGYGVEVAEATPGTFTVAKRKVRDIPTLTMGLFDGGNAADCMELVAGDPANVTRPTVSEIDGQTLVGPRVCGVMDSLTSAFNGFWEVYVVAANGANNGYFEVDDFAAPQPSPGDIYFHRVTELNSVWVDDSIYGGTPVHVGTGDVYGNSLVFTFGDGLDCNFVPLELVGGASGGSVATDTIWDAAGDLAFGTGADTAARLPLGTRGFSLVAGASAPEWVNNTPRTNIPVGANDWVLLSTTYGMGSQSVTVAGSAVSANGAARYLPFFVGKRIGVTGLGIDVSNGNAGASAVIRMGIHAENAGRPGTVVVDGGTASAATAAKEITFAETFLDPGWYYAVMVFQDLDTAGTNPQVRAALQMSSTAARTSVAATANQGVVWAATGVTGALADNPTVTTTTPFIPHIWLKVSTL